VVYEPYQTFTSLVATGGVAYILTCDGSISRCSALHLLAFSGASGALLWRDDPSEEVIDLRLEVADGHAYVTSNIQTTDHPSHAYTVFDAQSGAQQWVSPSSCPDAEVFPTADTAYSTCNLDASATLSALKPANGQPRWQQTLSGHPYPTTVNEASVEAVDDGLVYVGLQNTQAAADITPVVALDIQTGATVYGAPGGFVTEASGVAVFLTSTNTVVDGSSAYFFEYTVGDAHTGAALWTIVSGGSPVIGP
jgi:outer membrane protein assembly factor BamB